MDFKTSLIWVELLSNQFWLQGDKEKALNLPVSFLCDRNDTNVPKSQVGFIKGFIIPTFDIINNEVAKSWLIKATMNKTNISRIFKVDYKIDLST